MNLFNILKKGILKLKSLNKDGNEKHKYKQETNKVKTIYILWLQGFDNAPFVVKKCLESWVTLNPEWNVIKLDKHNLTKYIDVAEIIKDINKKSVTNASLSDIIRIGLLNKYGGLWVDATTYCTIPLDNWIDDYINRGFFAFRFNGINKQKPDRPISSWFIYGEKDNYIVNAWYKATVTYCNKTSVLGYGKPVSTKNKWQQHIFDEHYFWFHYLFEKLSETDTMFNNVWNTVPVLYETGPHFVQRKGLLNDLDNEVKSHIDCKKAPLYKLSYRYDASLYGKNCNLYYLLEAELSEVKIATSVFKVRDCFTNLRLIHIGKCGGTAIRVFFKDYGIKLNEFHLVKPDKDNEFKFIIWIRNPLHRFVSAFNHSLALINFDTSNLNINQLTIDNSLAPARIGFKMKHGYTFGKEYDELIKYFKTANNLAESLSSTNNELKEKALKLMTHPDEHIYKGIGWYLDNGAFIEKNNDKILFVGKLETMTEDLKRLSDLLGISLKNKAKVRENPLNDKYLSPLAIKNLINYFHNSEYKALKVLHKYGWIDEQTYQSYFSYKN
jgi:hypothetical protein